MLKFISVVCYWGNTYSNDEINCTLGAFANERRMRTPLNVMSMFRRCIEGATLDVLSWMYTIYNQVRSQFTWVDNQPVRRIQKNREKSVTGLRLSKSDFNVVHQAGVKHNAADAMSRLSTDGGETTHLVDELPVCSQEFICDKQQETSCASFPGMCRWKRTDDEEPQRESYRKENEKRFWGKNYELLKNERQNTKLWEIRRRTDEKCVVFLNGDASENERVETSLWRQRSSFPSIKNGRLHT